MIGLCFWWRQILLGVSTTVLTLGVLSGLGVLERYTLHEQRGTLLVRFTNEAGDTARLRIF